MKRHGDDAPVEAAMLEAGDLEGYAVWKGILKAVEEMMRMEPVEGGRLN